MTTSIQINPTITQFCHQIWSLTATAQYVEQQAEKMYLVVDKTPFHPVSHIWPDHPADRGYIVANQQQTEVEDCLVGAIEQLTGKLFVAEDIPVKRDAEGWVFVVVHQLPTSSETIKVGQPVELHVDQDYQDSLSRGHSAGHVAYLALNQVLAAHYWRKDADRKDPLGHYDFNSYAQVTSFVTPDLCTDNYRLGKTLKKRGLNVASVLDNLSEIEITVNQTIADWLEKKSSVAIKLDGECLTDSRYWQWQKNENVLISIPCGGTHINSTTELGDLTVKLTKLDDQHIEMQTHVNRG